MAPVRRHAYEAQFKLQAISYAVVNWNRAAAKEFNINESMVRKWRKQENELRQVKKTKQSFRGNKARWPQLEDQLFLIIEQRTAGRSVSTVTIRLKATKIAQDMKIEHFQGATASGLQRKARTYCSNKITHKKIQPNHIINMDEVPLTFDIPVNHTVEKKGTSTVSIRATGHEKLAFTVVLGCHDGEHTFTKTGRRRRASYGTICEWIVDAWAKVSALTVVRAFAKGGIIAEQPPGNETDSDNDEREPGMFDGEIAQLFNSDTEDEDFDVGED
ncbi:pogo transposable element with KRAB domain [Tachysurus ichikawai]